MKAEKLGDGGITQIITGVANMNILKWCADM
jgi:hypothetical protein